MTEIALVRSAALRLGLDRLVSLLDTGSTPAIKRTAALQLGQISNQRVRGGQKFPLSAVSTSSIKSETGGNEHDTGSSPDLSVGRQPSQPVTVSAEVAQHTTAASPPLYCGSRGEWDEALHLCSRIVPYLHSRSWETRDAAALAIESICRGAGIWNPDSSDTYANKNQASSSTIGLGVNQSTTTDETTLRPMSQDDLLSFDDFQFEKILANGEKLLSSAGKEYDVLASGGSVADHLARAKADMARMGLGSFGGIEMDLGLDVEEELKQGAQCSPKLPPPRFAPMSAAASMAQIDQRTGSIGLHRSEKSCDPLSPLCSPSGLQTPTSTASRNQPQLSPSLPPEDDVDTSKLSARERNQLKRKRKMESKNGPGSRDDKARKMEATPPSSLFASESLSANSSIRAKASISNALREFSAPQESVSGANVKVEKAESESQTAPSLIGSPAVSVNEEARGSQALSSRAKPSLVAPSSEWPFVHLTSLLLVDLFSPRWEVRHGACLALRSVFSVQGKGAGKSLLATSEEANAQRKYRWAEDAAVKLLCLLCLDRLSDFVFDQVVAPVREVAAQALSALLPHLSVASREKTRLVLIDMTKQTLVIPASAREARRFGQRGDAGYSWEVRHAGLSGLRWLVKAMCVEEKFFQAQSVKQEDAPLLQGDEVLDQVADVALNCLRDQDDDVRAVASAVLLPLASQKLAYELSSILPALLDTIWECLSDLKDDLNSSTAGIMDLLACLLKHETVSNKLKQTSQEPWSKLAPLIYPFFRHTITSVRLSVLRTLSVFLARADVDQASDWIDDRVFRLLFQNLIVEEKVHIRAATKEVWQTALRIASKTSGHFQKILAPHLDSLTKILMTPLGTPFDYSLFFSAVLDTTATNRGHYNVDKSILAQDLSLVGVDAVIRGRLDATLALGQAFAHLDAFDTTQLLVSLESASSLQRCLAAYVIQGWADQTWAVRGQELSITSPSAMQGLSEKLLQSIEKPAPPTWSEMAIQLSRIQHECQALLRVFHTEGKVAKTEIPILPVVVDPTGQCPDAFTSETAEKVVTREFEVLCALLGAKIRKQALPILEDRRRKIFASIGFYRDAKDKQDTQVFAAVSASIIALKSLPAKLNPIIRSIMNSVKFEENVDLQHRSAKAVADLVALCRSPAATADPSPKIIKNLCAFVCQDTSCTQVFTTTKLVEKGILSLKNELSTQPTRSKGGFLNGSEAEENEDTRQSRLIRRGAVMALGEMVEKFGQDLFVMVPSLWDNMTVSLIDTFQHGASTADQVLNAQPGGDERGQGVLDCCTLIEIVSNRLAASNSDVMQFLLPHLLEALKSKFAVIRWAAARCLSELANTRTQATMLFVVENVVPLLGDATNTVNRQGAIETFSHIVSLLDIKLLPYVVVLVVPVLGRMSDANEQVRLAASSTFAALIKMVPLDAGLPDPPGLPAELLKRRENEREFLAQLLDGNRVAPYDLPVKVNVELRKYQRDGVSWMKFLSRFQLHGILCDDMGLGKTLQSICILAASHFEREERFKATASLDSQRLPSLVVCPPTLTGHWVHEIGQYANNLCALLYSGGPAERSALQGRILNYDVVVLSYDVVRNDVSFLSTVDWNYCILDEGHIIKSSKTKTTKAVKMMKANHRLILTGTPIQNSVLELWSLFDFLMPGFLGTERAFHERFGKPLLATREGKTTSKEQEAAALALESLHKQVLPFLLRRLKDDVLDDLPPKIIQDIECDLGDIQKKLYEEYNASQYMEDVDEILQDESNLTKIGDPADAAKKHHVFQTLQYLRKLVNHPALIYEASSPSQKAVVDTELAKSKNTLRDISHAPKLQSLMQLLQSCGIGTTRLAEGELAAGPEAVSSQHRVLIFCQMKQMLDIIENDLFREHMTSVSYMRLDGSVPSEKRHGIVETFNSDPSIDVLLLTTQVGGLGLTLTGADTVIFVEHDWNPMKDLQAMDRAHRLGQKKVVNVYRLITRETLEARIMGLQQFKLNVANTVISQQNKGLDTMQTDHVLDLFSASASSVNAGEKKNQQSLVEAAIAARGQSAGGKGSKRISQKALLASLDAMGDTGEDYAAMNEWRPSGEL